MDKFVRKWKAQQRQKEVGSPVEVDLSEESEEVECKRSSEVRETYSDSEDALICEPKLVVRKLRGSTQARLQLVDSGRVQRAAIDSGEKLFDGNWLFDQLEYPWKRTRQSYEPGGGRLLALLESRVFESRNLERMPFRGSLRDSVSHGGLHSKAPHVSAVHFDGSGSLLVAASRSGDIRIFDFAAFVSKWNSTARLPFKDVIAKERKRRRQPAAVATSSALSPASDRLSESRSVSPMVSLPINEMPFAKATLTSELHCEDSRWNRANEKELVICGVPNANASALHSNASVCIYDLSKSLRFPCVRLNATLRNAMEARMHRMNYANNVLTNARIGGHSVFGADKCGRLCFWDRRSRKRATDSCLQPVFALKSPALASARTSHSAVSKGSVMNHSAANLHLSLDGNALTVCRRNGLIDTFDLRKRSAVRCLNLWQATAFGSAKHALVEDAFYEERGHGTAYFSLNNCNVVRFDCHKSAVVDSVICDNTAAEEQIDASFLAGISQRRMALVPNSLSSYSRFFVGGTLTSEVAVSNLSLGKRLKQRVVCENGRVSVSDSAVLGRCQTAGIVTSVAVHPNASFFACGNLSNYIELIQVGNVFE